MKSLIQRVLLLACSIVLAGRSIIAAATPATQPLRTTAIRVAIYTDIGAPDGPASGPFNVTQCLNKSSAGKYFIQKVNGDDIRHGALDHFDVAVFPGGSGSGQAKSLEAAGREKVRQFVERGGGYLGICGGAYLATSCYPWSLNIVNAKVIDRAHWNRGDPAPVKLELTPLGETQLDEKRKEVTCIYHQGPLLGPYNRKGLPPYQTLATFGTEITERGPKGVMIGTTAIVQAPFGKGHVILISPHPERSDGLDGFIRQSVDWVGQGPSAVSATPPGAAEPATTQPAM